MSTDTEAQKILQAIKAKVAARNERLDNTNDWEMMGEQIKIEDNIEPIAQYFNEEEIAKRDEEFELLQRLREKPDYNQKVREHQFAVQCPVEQSEIKFRRNDSLDHTITIGDNEMGELIRIHTDTGDIEYGEHYTPDAAANVFWSALSGGNPALLKKEIAELKAELDSYAVPKVDTAQDESSSYDEAMKIIK